MVIDGKARSAEILSSLKGKIPAGKILVGVLIGSDKSSLNFLRQKEKIARELGISFLLKEIPEEYSQIQVENIIKEISDDPKVGGIVIELPLPEKFEKQSILDAVSPEKDPDCLSTKNVGEFYLGQGDIKPLSVEVVEDVIRMKNIDLLGKKIAVIGSGVLVGKPIALWLWLQNQASELTIFNSSSKNLRERLKNADLVISGAGQAHVFQASDLKENAVTIDFGYDELEGRITGDFNPEGASEKMLYTPVPGGAGPILIAKLFEVFCRMNRS